MILEANNAPLVQNARPLAEGIVYSLRNIPSTEGQVFTYRLNAVLRESHVRGLSGRFKSTKRLSCGATTVQALSCTVSSVRACQASRYRAPHSPKYTPRLNKLEEHDRVSETTTSAKTCASFPCSKSKSAKHPHHATLTTLLSFLFVFFFLNQFSDYLP